MLVTCIKNVIYPKIHIDYRTPRIEAFAVVEVEETLFPVVRAEQIAESHLVLRLLLELLEDLGVSRLQCLGVLVQTNLTRCIFKRCLDRHR